MAARVQIIVESKDASSGVIRAITSQFGALGNVFQELTAKNVSWGNVAEQATKVVIEGLKESIRATVEYANQVRSLSQISGESTENTSRFIQVLDDFKISADDATAATRALTKNGLTPNIDTLAELSDQYLKLNTAQARNEFVIKNLGRAGLQWVEVLSKGSAELRKMGEEVSDSLILSEKAVRQAREYELAIDDWNDAVQGLQITLGNALLPVLTEFIEAQLRSGEAMQRSIEEGRPYVDIVIEMREQSEAAKEAQLAHADAMDKQAMAAGGLTAALDKINYKDVISTTLQMQEAQDKLKNTNIELVAKMNDLRAAYASGRVTTKEFESQMGDLQKAYRQNATEAELWAKRTIFSMVQTRLAASGNEIDSNEFNFLTELGVEMGLIDKKTADTATSINRSLDKLDTEGAQLQVEDFKDKWQELLNMPKEVNFVVTVVQSGIVTPPIQQTTDTLQQDYATGGWVYAARGMWMGRPRGTDTIPAMLTPGERVLSVPEVARMGGREGVEKAVNGGNTNVFYGPNNFIVESEAMDIMEMR